MSTTFQDTGGRAKLERLFSQLRERIPEEVLRPSLAAIAEEVASRAPTPTQEHDVMMYGEEGYGSAATRQPRNSTAAVTAEDNRVRFIKPAENYLRNYLPASFGFNGLFGGVGDIDELNAISAYEYVNADTKGNTWQHAVTQPFWWAWEVGGIFNVRPHGYSNKRYPLMPFPNTPAFEMIKMISPRYMFHGANVEGVLDSVFKTRLERLIQSLQ